MKKTSRNLILLLIIAISLSSFACSATIGNDKANSNSLSFASMSVIEKPIANYQLINNNREYELVSIEENYIGAFMIDFYYSNPDNGYGYLPVTSIATGAFKNYNSVFFVIIADNITHIGRGAFEGWRFYQAIYFLISEDDLKTPTYDFDDNWNENMEASVQWGVDGTNFKYPTFI